MRAIRIDPDGTFIELDLPNQGDAWKPAMQTAVGGYYAVESLPCGMTAWSNEDGRYEKNIGPNTSATAALVFLGLPVKIVTMQHGPVVIGGTIGRDGKPQSLTREASAKLESFLAYIAPYPGGDE